MKALHLKGSDRGLTLDDISGGRLHPRDFFMVTSACMNKLKKRAQLIAGQEGPVLIEGQTGTGKTMLAEFLHHISPRSNKALIVRGCGEFTDNIMESMLYGHTRGAFTGADKDTDGLLKLADGGTFVLNDIDLLSLDHQSRLMRFLDDGTFYKLGEPGRPKKVDVRIIATTNKNLEHFTDNKRFMPDLLFRLRRWRLKVPSLEARTEDVVAFAAFFLAQFQAAGHLSEDRSWSFSGEAQGLLKSMVWPGNLRQLREAVENIALFCEGDLSRISYQQAAKVLFDPEYSIGQRRQSEDQDAQLHQALIRTNWNISQASKITGMSRTTVYDKVKKHGWKHPTQLSK